MTRGVAFVALMLALVAAVACGSSSKQSSPPTTVPAPVDLRGHATVEVQANGNLFTPPSIIVDPGTKVTWKNTDTQAHDVQKASNNAGFGDEFAILVSKFGPGASYSFTFDEPGSYLYTCTIHTGMNGQVEVVPKSSNSVTSSTAVG